MLLPPRIFSGDEELGKRDDDHKPAKSSPLANVLMSSRLPQKRNLKRLGILFAILVVFYVFFKNIPTDVGPQSRRPYYTHEPGNAASSWNRPSPQAHRDSAGRQLPKKDADAAAGEEHWFNGAIKFYKLAASLHAIAMNGYGGWLNRNVLFAASNLKSASALLPMACEMSKLKRNIVHFAVFGRDDISIDTLKEINGVNNGCDIWYHDARPDYSVQSSDYRMEVSCGAALNHINNFMHPQSVIIDGSEVEDLFFKTGIRKKAYSLERTLIELPKNAEQNLMWISRLDSSSLSAWNKISVTIVVHAQSAASGSLLRLLSSLSKADYFSSIPPALTIELPHEMDAPTEDRLRSFKWPPVSHGHIEGNANRLSLRHRIPQNRLTAEESSIRFLESFWPTNPDTSHVLVLSPHVELSPLFFHYLKYTLLEYKYGVLSSNDQTLVGISLDLPSTYLNDSTNFFPPYLKDSLALDTGATSPFLWQAPNSNAALYFGDHWVELHSFVSKSLASKQQLPAPTTLNKKLISKTYPSWLEYMLGLSRTRGYALLYPNLANQTALATVHNELYHPPEEFRPPKEDSPDIYTDTDEDWVVDPPYLSLKHEEMPLARTSLYSALPSDSILPGIGLMPRLTWDGNEITEPNSFHLLAESYAETFRMDIGGCTLKDDVKMKVKNSAEDLFCLKKKKDAHGTGEATTPQKLAPLLTQIIADTAADVDTAFKFDTVPGTDVPFQAGSISPGSANSVVAADEVAPKKPAPVVDDTSSLTNTVQNNLGDDVVAAPDESSPETPAKTAEGANAIGNNVLSKLNEDVEVADGNPLEKPPQIVEDTVNLGNQVPKKVRGEI